MRRGVFLANVGTYADPRTVVKVAEAAEEAGWEALLLWDHLGFVWGVSAADPWVTLAAVAVKTSRLVLGTGVTPLPRRRPQILAHQVATLDILSGGRVVFGAGIGGVPREFEAFGEPGDARVRAEMLDEGLEVVSGLWAGEEVNYHGRHVVVDGVRLRPAPPRGKVPIWIGGNSPAALRRAARWDGWAADTAHPERMVVSPDDLAAKVAEIQRGRAAGAPFDVVVFGYSEVGDRREQEAYEAAGATWWLEYFHDRRAGLDETLGRIRAGPGS